MTRTIKVNLIYLRGLIRHGQGKRIAEKLGVHRYTLSKKLNGDRSFTVDELSDIAVFLGVNADEFVEIKKSGLAEAMPHTTSTR